MTSVTLRCIVGASLVQDHSRKADSLWHCRRSHRSLSSRFYVVRSSPSRSVTTGRGSPSHSCKRVMRRSPDYCCCQARSTTQQAHRRDRWLQNIIAAAVARRPFHRHVTDAGNASAPISSNVCERKPGGRVMV